MCTKRERTEEMIKRYKLGMGAVLAFVLVAGGVLAGELTPPGPPGSTMKTLQEIYDKIENLQGVVMSGDALAGDILEGKNAWVMGDEVIGTMPNIGQQNVIPGTEAQTITQGYHDGTGSVAGDAGLVAGHIKKDIAIFGVMGTFQGDGTYNAAVPKTGQTRSYASGDDGDLEKGVAWPNPRFTDNGNGTVTDNLTSLVWLKNASAFGTRTWATALTDCATLKSGAHGLGDGSIKGDWRLPNLRELLSLIDYDQSSPALPEGHPFTGVKSDRYWSSSTFAGITDQAWFVNLYDSFIFYGTEDDTDYVWPVRERNMVSIPGGTNSGTDPDYGFYSLTVDSFYMDRREVTNDEMVRVMQWAYDNGKLEVISGSVKNALGDKQELLDLNDSHSRITWGGEKFGIKSSKGSGYPCVEVTWFGAAAYCNYRSEMEGRTPCYNLSDWSCNTSANGYRLPTNDEWEYAARGGVSSNRFPFGDTIQHAKANYKSTSDDYTYDTSATRGYHPDYDDGEYPYTSPVGSFSPNGYGLYDMAGNVWEWCNDASGSNRSVRGGGWNNVAANLRCGRKRWEDPSTSYNNFGFRAVCR